MLLFGAQGYLGQRRRDRDQARSAKRGYVDGYARDARRIWSLDFATSGSAAIAERSLFQASVRTNHLRRTHLISPSSYPRRRDNGLETGSAIVTARLLFGAETVGRNA